MLLHYVIIGVNSVIGWCADTFEIVNTGSYLQRVKDAKVTVRLKRVLVVTELFDVAVNDFEARKSARLKTVVHCNRTRCNRDPV